MDRPDRRQSVRHARHDPSPSDRGEAPAMALPRCGACGDQAALHRPSLRPRRWPGRVSLPRAPAAARTVRSRIPSDADHRPVVLPLAHAHADVKGAAAQRARAGILRPDSSRSRRPSGTCRRRLAQVSSRRGTIRLKVRISDRVPPHLIFVPIHWGDLYAQGNAANYLTISATGRVAKQPEFKSCAVTIEQRRWKRGHFPPLVPGHWRYDLGGPTTADRVRGVSPIWRSLK